MSRHSASQRPDGQPARDVPTQGEQVEILNDGEPEEKMLPPPEDVARSQVVADATVKNPEAQPEPTKPTSYARVVRGGAVLENGFRTTLKEGKVVDSLNYNFKRLQQQGIRLEKIEKEDATFVE